jgi:hypothetical protein
MLSITCKQMLNVFELLQIQATLKPLCPNGKQVGNEDL